MPRPDDAARTLFAFYDLQVAPITFDFLWFLVGADLRGANLFGTDMTRVRVDGRTQIDRADLRRARVHPKRKEGGSFGGP